MHCCWRHAAASPLLRILHCLLDPWVTLIQICRQGSGMEPDLSTGKHAYMLLEVTPSCAGPKRSGFPAAVLFEAITVHSLASSVSRSGNGLKELIKLRSCLKIAIPLAWEEEQRGAEHFLGLLSTGWEGTVLSALSALQRCPPSPNPCKAPHLCCSFSCASIALLCCGQVAGLISAKKKAPFFFLFCRLCFTSY